MREIFSMVKLSQDLPTTILCPICGSNIPHYDPEPKLRIAYEDIAQKLDKITERFPSCAGDVVKVKLVLTGFKGDMIYGHPVEYQIEGEG